MREERKGGGTAHQVVVTGVVLASAVPLWILSGAAAAACAVGLAVLYYASAGHWRAEILRARQEKSILDEQLIQSQKLASIGELSAGIGHEINNPLAIIGQESEWMQHLLKEDPAGHAEEIKESVQEVTRQVERCREIIQKLLNFARKMEPVIQAVDVNKLIEDMAKLVDKEAVLNNIRITRQYQPDLPPVFTDPPLLRQVVLNFLNNATYAIQKDGCITVGTQLSDGEHVGIVVSDTGCGIAKDDLKKIFDPFYTTKPPGKGTGLGLAICHGIIERLGGRICVASEVGKGTTFTVLLPTRKNKGAR